jgi:Mg2+/Co2+ transporter CorB
MESLLEQIYLYWQQIEIFFSFDTTRLIDTDILLRLILQVFLLCCAAFFAGSETALFSLSRLDLQKLRKEKHRYSETLHELLDQPRRLIISILSGNELVNIAATANMT